MCRKKLWKINFLNFQKFSFILRKNFLWKFLENFRKNQGNLRKLLEIPVTFFSKAFTHSNDVITDEQRKWDLKNYLVPKKCELQSDLKVQGKRERSFVNAPLHKCLMIYKECRRRPIVLVLKVFPHQKHDELG